MALRDIFKKKKPKEEKPKLIEKAEAIEESKKIRPPKSREKTVGEAYRVLKSPHITEKATELVKKDQYIFQISRNFNKTEVKKAIESLYGIDVLTVKIINVPPKKRRLGRIEGWRKAYKKAIVRIKEGQKIEVLPR